MGPTRRAGLKAAGARSRRLIQQSRKEVADQRIVGPVHLEIGVARVWQRLTCSGKQTSADVEVGS